MSCEERRDQVLLYAAGELNPDEAAEVRQHLAGGCPQCAGFLAEAEAALALLPLALPLTAPSPGVRQRLMARVAAGPNRAASAGAPFPIPVARAIQPPWWAQIAVPSAIAASVAAVLAIVFATRLNNRQQAMLARQQPPQSDAAVGMLTALVQRQQHELAELKSSDPAQTAQWAADADLKVFRLAGTTSQPVGARGRVFWDARGQWHFFASGLKPALAGKTYELWFVTSDGKAVPAGSFNPTSAGDATLVTSVPPSIAGTVTVAAVTDEPAGTALTAPTGAFQLKGSL